MLPFLRRLVHAAEDFLYLLIGYKVQERVELLLQRRRGPLWQEHEKLRSRSAVLPLLDKRAKRAAYTREPQWLMTVRPKGLALLGSEMGR